MSRNSTSALKLILLGIAVILLSGACAPKNGQAATPAPEGTFPVDSIFREFYSLLGGERNLGYAISPMVEYGDVKMQYTEAVLMRYDAIAPASQRYSLAPLGLELNVTDPPFVLPEQSGTRIVDGYIVYDEFASLYDALQGARFVGKPLTQVRIDYERGRIEQYFENVGFYRLMDDPPKTVHLLAYGSWKCDAYCRYESQASSAVAPQPIFPEPLISSLARLGADFAGRPLSEPYMASDGMLEQVYTNIVVYADPANVRLIALRPISSQVGYAPTALVGRSDDQRMVFYPLENGLGHLVPKVFEDFITLHGGMEISGNPTTEVFQEGSIYRQCFTSYCLDYDPAAAETLRVRLAPLGERYLKNNPPQQVAEAPSQAPGVAYHLAVSEAHSLISSEQEQVVTLEITASSDQTPVSDLEASLELTLPDGTRSGYHFQPTGEDGRSSVALPPVSGPNGTLIPYQICLNGGTSPQCVLDSYVIWGNP